MLREQEEAAVSGIHVEPAPLALGERGDGVERIHGTRVGGAGRRDDHPWAQPARAVVGDGLRERIGAHAKALVERDVADHHVGQAREPQRLLDAVVRLRGEVDDSRRHVCAETPCASRAVAIATRFAMLPPEAMLPPALAG